VPSASSRPQPQPWPPVCVGLCGRRCVATGVPILRHPATTRVCPQVSIPVCARVLPREWMRPLAACLRHQSPPFLSALSSRPSPKLLPCMPPGAEAPCTTHVPRHAAPPRALHTPTYMLLCINAHQRREGERQRTALTLTHSTHGNTDTWRGKEGVCGPGQRVRRPRRA